METEALDLVIQGSHLVVCPRGVVLLVDAHLGAEDLYNLEEHRAPQSLLVVDLGRLHLAADSVDGLADLDVLLLDTHHL